MKPIKKNGGVWLIVVFALVVFVAMGLIMTVAFYTRTHPSAVLEDVEEAGDETSDSFDWKGSYIDTMYLETTLDISGGFGGTYDVSLTWGEPDSDDLSIWSATATYDKKHKALVYQDAIRTNMTIPADDSSDVEATSSDVYSSGVGFFFVRDNKVYWKDRNEDFGSGMQFEKN